MNDPVNSPYKAALNDAIESVAVWKNPDVKWRKRMSALVDVLVFSRLAEASSVHEVHVVGQESSQEEQQTESSQPDSTAPDGAYL